MLRRTSCCCEDILVRSWSCLVISLLRSWYVRTRRNILGYLARRLGMEYVLCMSYVMMLSWFNLDLCSFLFFFFFKKKNNPDFYLVMGINEIKSSSIWVFNLECVCSVFYGFHFCLLWVSFSFVYCTVNTFPFCHRNEFEFFLTNFQYKLSIIRTLQMEMVR